MSKNRWLSVAILFLAVWLVYGLFGNSEKSREAFLSDIDANIAIVNKSVADLPITDEALRACIAHHAQDLARIPATNSGSIRHVNELELLSCAGKGIESIDGIAALTNLRYLDVRRNNIKGLSGLTDHPSLQHVILSRNPVNSIRPLSRMPNLREVALPRLSDMRCDEIERILSGVRYMEAATYCQKQPTRLKAKKEKAEPAYGTRLTDDQEQELFDYEMR